ncbi:hypothetical protein VTH06DRAFT_831 [Thermothelomyces fergusii]
MSQGDQILRRRETGQHQQHKQNSQSNQSRLNWGEEAAEGGGAAEGDVGLVNVRSWYHIGAGGGRPPCQAPGAVVRLGLGLAQLLPSLFLASPFPRRPRVPIRRRQP